MNRHIPSFKSKNIDESSKLYEACQNGDKKEVERILKTNNNVNDFINQKNTSGERPINAAISSKKAEIVEILVQAGAGVNLYSHGQTPLHKAVLAKSESCVKVLLKYGANSSLLDEHNTTALVLATERHYQDVKKAIILSDILKAVKRNDGKKLKDLSLGSEWSKMSYTNQKLCLGEAIRSQNTWAVGLFVAKWPAAIKDCLTNITSIDVFSNLEAVAMLLLAHLIYENKTDKLWQICSKSKNTKSVDLHGVKLNEHDLEKIRDCIGKMIERKSDEVAFLVRLSSRNENSQKARSLILQTFYTEKKVADWSGLSLSYINNELLQELTDFTWLNLSSNKISALPLELKYALYLEKIQRLDLSWNNMESVPSVLFTLPNLKSLNLSHNSLRDLPKIAVAAKLQTLDLNTNRLLDINLKTKDSSIYTLNVSNNRLVTVPSSILKSKYLEILNISKNDIHELPNDLGKLKHLKEFDFDCKKISNIPSQYVINSSECLDYLRAVIRSSQPVYLMKALSYGKLSTSKISKCLHGGKHVTAKILQDIEFEFAPTSKQPAFTFRILDVDTHKNNLNICRAFAANDCIHVITWDVTEDVDPQLSQHLCDFYSTTRKLPLLVVGYNIEHIKGDSDHLQKFYERKTGEIMKLGTSKSTSYLYISFDQYCPLYESGVQNLRNKLYEAASDYANNDNVKLMGRYLPQSYVYVQHQVEERSAPTLNRQQIAAMNEGNEKDSLLPEDVDFVINYMHSVGTLLHSKHMGDCYFTDPLWTFSLVVQFVEATRHCETLVWNKQQIKATMKKSWVDNNLEEFLHVLQTLNLSYNIDGDERLFLLTAAHYPTNIGGNYGQVRRYFFCDTLPYTFWNRLNLRIVNYLTEIIDTNNFPTDEEDLSPFGDEDSNSEEDELGISVNMQRLSVSENSSENKSVIDGNLGSKSVNKEVKQHEIDDLIGHLKCYVDGIVFDNGKFTFSVLQCRVSINENMTGVEIQVPDSPLGMQVLCRLIDHVMTVAEEWYPQELLLDQSLLACPLCVLNNIEPPEYFKVADMFEKLRNHQPTKILCQQEHIPRSVDLFAYFPDLTLDTFPDSKNIGSESFVILPNQKNNDSGIYKGMFNENLLIVAKKFKTDLKSFYSARKEITILDSVASHEFVVSFYGFSFDQRDVYALMEFALYGDLSKVVHKISRVVALNMCHQIARGLAFLHENRIVYRDLKPQNVLIFSLDACDRVNAKLADFGEADCLSPGGMNIKCGTPNFKAPELFQAQQQYGYAVDIYAFAMLIYHVIGGPKIQENEPELKREVTHGVRQRLTRKKTPQAFYGFLTSHVLMRAMWRQNPNDRPTAAQVSKQHCWLAFRLLYGVHTMKKVVKHKCAEELRCCCYVEQTNEIWIAYSVKKEHLIAIVDLCSFERVAEIPVNGVTFQLFKPNTMICLDKYHVCLFLRSSNDGCIIYDVLQRLPIKKYNTDDQNIRSMCVNDKHLFLGLQNGVCMQTHIDKVVAGELFEGAVRFEIQEKVPLSMCATDELVLRAAGHSVAHRNLSKEEEGLKLCHDTLNIHLIRISHDGTLFFVTYVYTPLVRAYNLNTFEFVFEFNCSCTCEKVDCECQITAMCSYLKQFWIGTNSGRIFIYKIGVRGARLIGTMHPYLESVKSLEFLSNVSLRKRSQKRRSNLKDNSYEASNDERLETENEEKFILSAGKFLNKDVLGRNIDFVEELSIIDGQFCDLQSSGVLITWQILPTELYLPRV